MNWTKERPTVEGWYWGSFGDRAKARMLEYEKWRGRMVCVEDRDVVEWYGPLTPPGDA